MAAARGGVIPPTPNPYVYDSGPDNNNRRIVAAFAWNATTRAITGVTVTRDPGCSFTTVMVGLGTDGSPNTSNRTFSVPDGTSVVPAATISLLATRGLATIDNLLMTQITAG